MAIAVVVMAGEVNRQRNPLLARFVRCQPATGKVAFRAQLLQEAVTQVMYNQIVVVDTEFDIAELQAAHVRQYVVRLATNCTARRNQLPACKGKGWRSRFGAKVRPFPRTWQDRPLAVGARPYEPVRPRWVPNPDECLA